MDERLPVDRIRNRLAHSQVLQDGIAQVKRHVAEHGARRAQDLKPRIACQRQHHVGEERVDFDVRAPLTQLKRARRRIRNHHKAHTLQPAFLSPVIVVALDDNVSILLSADEAKRPAADGIAADLVTATERNDAHASASGKVP